VQMASGGGRLKIIVLFAQLIQVDNPPVSTLYGSVAAQDLGGAKAKQLLSACAPGEELTIKRDDQLRDFRRQAAGSPTVMPPSYGAQNPTAARAAVGWARASQQLPSGSGSRTKHQVFALGRLCVVGSGGGGLAIRGRGEAVVRPRTHQRADSRQGSAHLI
jgi:hypothetical protein